MTETSTRVVCLAVHRQGYTGTVRDLTVIVGPADRRPDLQRVAERMCSQNGTVTEISYQRAAELAQHEPYTLHGLWGVAKPEDLDWLGLPGPHLDQVSHSDTYIPRRIERCQQETSGALVYL